MQIILIDNYDSFTYNLVHYLEKWGAQVEVVLNDDITPDWNMYDACVISPGPGLPQESGHLLTWIGEWSKTNKPLLGICLGLQAIVLHAGGTLKQMSKPLHGVEGRILNINDQSIWCHLAVPQIIAHYHSWMADETTFPRHFTVTAKDHEGKIMAIENLDSPWFGLQFHPESIMTPDGYHWIATWCNFVAKKKKDE
jgi:anthranilate synthase component 2